MLCRPGLTLQPDSPYIEVEGTRHPLEPKTAKLAEALIHSFGEPVSFKDFDPNQLSVYMSELRRCFTHTKFRIRYGVHGVYCLEEVAR